jgi:integrase
MRGDHAANRIKRQPRSRRTCPGGWGNSIFSPFALAGSYVHCYLTDTKSAYIDTKRVFVSAEIMEPVMPSVALSANLVRTATCPPNKGKLDLFDTNCKGLMLEVRTSGGRTWYLRHTDARGRQRQHRIADARDLSLDSARKQANRLRGQIALGHDPGQERAALRMVPTFAEFIRDRYMPFVQGYKRAWRTDDSLLRNHLLPVLGGKHLDEITKNDIITIHHGRRAAGAAPASANRLLVLLRCCFNLALKWEVAGLTKNPTAGIPLLEENNKRERYLSMEEVRHLYDAVVASKSEMLKYIVPMLILTGARKREVLDARWEDFDLTRRLWRIPLCKTGKARHVPLSDGMLGLLQSIPRFDGCPFVVPNLKSRLPFVSIFVAWQTARKAAGLPDVRVHDLRHSYASFLINAGRSLYEVQRLLGHTQIKTTQRYAHLKPETLLDATNSAAQSMGVAFFAALPSPPTLGGEALGIVVTTPVIP